MDIKSTNTKKRKNALRRTALEIRKIRLLTDEKDFIKNMNDDLAKLIIDALFDPSLVENTISAYSVADSYQNLIESSNLQLKRENLELSKTLNEAENDDMPLG